MEECKQTAAAGILFWTLLGETSADDFAGADYSRWV